MAVDLAGVDTHVKFGDSRLNSGIIIRHFLSWAHFVHFYVVFNCIFFSRPEAAGAVISGMFVRLIVPIML